ncbi:XRE family transcriptional regulator [Catellatospora sp. NPDC049111]|uniref:helix-turn-helix domain-containing protein n=1 Tax=Catellatospora sp. NPDC049111 TaxID=3155271 RepID=UPI0033CB26CD
MRKTDEPDDLFSFGDVIDTSPKCLAAEAAKHFDPARLTQARQLAGLTKRELADQVGVSAAAIGQYETGTRPRPEVLMGISAVLGYEVGFFRIGRPYARLDASAAHFRSLRDTRAYQRAKAVSFTEQVWELIYALERRIVLPYVNLPGFAAGEVTPGTNLPSDPVLAAKALRHHWGLGAGPIPHLVRTLEINGIVVVHAPKDGDLRKVDAFSTSRLPRPFIVISRDRTKDVYRSRFTAAHELGHLALHGDALPGDPGHERDADAFAAEFLTPRDSIVQELPTKANFTAFADLQRTWGTSISSLIFRCREVGLYSDTTTSRTYQRLHQLITDGAITLEPVDGFPGELPSLLREAFNLAADGGLTLEELGSELQWPRKRLSQLLGTEGDRPALSLLRGDATGDGSESLGTNNSQRRRLTVVRGAEV